MRTGCSASCSACVHSKSASYQLALHTLLLAFGTGGRPGDIDSLSGVALANACSLTAQIAEVVKLSAADVTLLHHVDVIDDGSVQRKNSFNADSETGLAHGDRFTRTAVLAGNTHTFESLQTFFGF